MDKKKIEFNEFEILKLKAYENNNLDSKAPLIMLSIGYSFLGLQRFYRNQHKLGLICLMMTLLSFASVIVGSMINNHYLMIVSLILFILMFLIVPTVETIITFKERKLDRNKRDLALIKELKDITSSYEILEDKSKQIQLEMMEFDIKRKKKSQRMSALLLSFLGGFGAHKFYQNKKSEGLIYLGITILSLILSASNEYLILLGNLLYFILFVFLVRDFFNNNRVIRKYNQKIDEEKIKILNNYNEQ